MTFQVALVGCDGLVIASDRMMVDRRWVPRAFAAHQAELNQRMRGTKTVLPIATMLYVRLPADQQRNQWRELLQRTANRKGDLPFSGKTALRMLLSQYGEVAPIIWTKASAMTGNYAKSAIVRHGVPCGKARMVSRSDGDFPTLPVTSLASTQISDSTAGRE